MVHNNRIFACHLFLGFLVQGKITEADTPTVRLGATPSELISDPPPPSPIFTPDALPVATLPISFCLRQAQKYAGLHTSMAWLYPQLISQKGGTVVQRVRHMGLRSVGRGFESCWRQRCVTTLGKLFTPMCLCHQAV